jgi:hypothetical protein
MVSRIAEIQLLHESVIIARRGHEKMAGANAPAMFLFWSAR